MKRRWVQIFFWLFVLPTSIRAAGQDTSSTDNPPARVGRVSFVKGNVSFLRAGLDEWSEATQNFPVTTGDRLYADKGSWAEVQAGPFTVRIGSETDLTVTNLDDQTLQLGLDQGTVRLSVYDLPSGNSVEVDTTNLNITAQRPGSYRIDADSDRNRTSIVVNHGSVQVSGSGFAQGIEEGQAFEFAGQDPPQVKRLTLPSPDAFDVWADERDRRREASTSAQYVSPATPGYDDLDDYGRWDVVADYGPVWYPPVAVGWLPYRFGHWAWIDPWGWSWIEDEPWGFCQFHFGRWVLIGSSWGWLPGPLVAAPVYAPAMVAFLGGTRIFNWYQCKPGGLVPARARRTIPPVVSLWS